MLKGHHVKAAAVALELLGALGGLRVVEGHVADLIEVDACDPRPAFIDAEQVGVARRALSLLEALSLLAVNSEDVRAVSALVAANDPALRAL